jgi:hypothetical protein
LKDESIAKRYFKPNAIFLSGLRIKPSSPCADGLIEGKCELSIKYATTEIKVPSGFQLPVGEVHVVAHTFPLIYTAE